MRLFYQYCRYEGKLYFEHILNTIIRYIVYRIVIKLLSLPPHINNIKRNLYIFYMIYTGFLFVIKFLDYQSFVASIIFTTHVSVLLSTVAVIVVVPALRPITSPEDDTVAILAFPVLHEIVCPLGIPST